MCDTKYCAYGDHTLPVDNFRLNKNGKPVSYCRDCEPKYQKEYAETHRDQLAAQKAAWRMANPGKHAEANKKSYQKKQREKEDALKAMGLPTLAERKADKAHLEQLKAEDPAAFKAAVETEKLRALDTLIECRFGDMPA